MARGLKLQVFKKGRGIVLFIDVVKTKALISYIFVVMMQPILILFQHEKEQLDPRGRTPLHLAVALGYLESARVLLKYGADANAENKSYWSGKNLHEVLTALGQLANLHSVTLRYFVPLPWQISIGPIQCNVEPLVTDIVSWLLF